MSEVGSIVVRRQLGRELRSWRERAQRTLDDVAIAQIASVSKVHRIEHSRTSVRPGDVRELCRLYGVSHETTEALADLARATRDPDWWERPETAHLGAAPRHPGRILAAGVPGSRRSARRLRRDLRGRSLP